MELKDIYYIVRAMDPTVKSIERENIHESLHYIFR